MTQNEIFKLATNANSLKKLVEIIASNPSIQKFIENFKNKYPCINLSLSNVEVEKLFSDGYINQEDYKINCNKEFSAFEKLLLAVLWKNGHINRASLILEGIKNDYKSDSDFGIIFRQFGKSLISRDEPIVDQHTLHAFITYSNEPSVQDIKGSPKKTIYRKKDEHLIEDYKEWFNSVLSKIPEPEKQEFGYLLDKILFAIGKQMV